MKRACMLTMMVVVAVGLAARPAQAEKFMVTGDGDDVLGNIVGHYFVPCLGERVSLKDYPELKFRDAGDQHCQDHMGLDSAQPDVAATADSDETNAGDSADTDASPKPDPLAAANKHIEKVLADYRKKHRADDEDCAPDV
ncbi:MAG: hypothetical protein WA294_00855 [Acidobacteriaceae bacterium]